MPWYGECYDFSTIDVNRYDNLKRYNYVLKTSNDKANIEYIYRGDFYIE